MSKTWKRHRRNKRLATPNNTTQWATLTASQQVLPKSTDPQGTLELLGGKGEESLETACGHLVEKLLLTSVADNAEEAEKASGAQKGGCPWPRAFSGSKQINCFMWNTRSWLPVDTSWMWAPMSTQAKTSGLGLSHAANKI